MRITITASARWLLNNDDNNAAPLIEKHNQQLTDAPAGSSVLTVQRFDHNGRLLWCITNADRSETIVCTPGDRDKTDWSKPSPAWEEVDTSQPYTEPPPTAREDSRWLAGVRKLLRKEES